MRGRQPRNLDPELEDATVDIQVVGTNGGIKQELIDYIFEPFVTNKETGTEVAWDFQSVMEQPRKWE